MVILAICLVSCKEIAAFIYFLFRWVVADDMLLRHVNVLFLLHIGILLL